MLIESYNQILSKQIIRTNLLLAAITHAQTNFNESKKPEDVFKGLLNSIVNITGSKCGFMGEVFKTKRGILF